MMMPIRPENRKRYPPSWSEISQRIRFDRAQGRCECEGECGHDHADDPSIYDFDGRCEAVHGEPHPVTGSDVVLTVAHLISVTQLPMNFHVTAAAKANDVSELVGFLVPIEPKLLKRLDMVRDRAFTEFLAGPTTSCARFIVAIPRSPAGGSPGRSIVARVSSVPIWIVLSSWRLSRPPREPTNVTAKAPSGVQIKSGDAVHPTTFLAGADAESTLRSTYEFSATGRRTSAATICGLLRREWNGAATDGAIDTELTLARSGHAAAYHIGTLPENCDDDNLKAMCQRCHNAYDAPMRRQGMRERERAKAAVGDLFEANEKNNQPPQ